MSRFLVADIEEHHTRFGLIFQPKHELIFATTILAVDRILEQSTIDAIICGILFDDSRMIELLSRLKKDKQTADIPFICWQNTDGPVLRNSTNTVHTAANALGASLYVTPAQAVCMTDDALMKAVEQCLNQTVQ